MHKIIVNGESMEWHEEMTIRDILRIRNYTFRMLVIKVNDQLIKKPEWDRYRVPDGAEVKVIHLISGG